MWGQPNVTNFYGRSYRSTQPEMVQAIISCQLSVCLIIFSIFLIAVGSIFRFLVGGDQKDHFSETPRLIGTILLTIGGIMIGCASVCIFCCLRYHKKSKQFQTPGTITINYDSSAPPMLVGVNYPVQAGYQYHAGYQPVSQNVIYNPTTEPNSQIS